MMTIDDLMEKLNILKEKVGGDNEIVFVSKDGENDIFVPKYPVAGDFEDCDGNEYKCAIVISMNGEEFTKKDIPHYKWNSREDEVNGF